MKFLKKKIVIIIISLIIAGTGTGAYLYLKNPSVAKKIGKPPVYNCSLCGREVKKADQHKKPLAVMVENLSTVRPQSGLSDACMVFEALAEGGITRFVAVYAGHSRSKTIGPVRSARPYFVSIARGFEAAYAHAGGSDKGKQEIYSTGIDDLDEFKFPAYYWRDNSRSAPHNLFTNMEKLREAILKAGYDEIADFTGFEFNKKLIKKKPKEDVIGVEYSQGSNYVSYQYQSKTNSYDRYNGHYLQKDAVNGKTLSPKNVVVVFTHTSADIGLTLDIDIEGEGPAVFFIGGKTINGSWSKYDSSTQFEFKDTEDKEIKFNPGQTWVQVVKTGTQIKGSE